MFDWKFACRGSFTATSWFSDAGPRDCFVKASATVMVVVDMKCVRPFDLQDDTGVPSTSPFDFYVSVFDGLPWLVGVCFFWFFCVGRLEWIFFLRFDVALVSIA